VDSGPVVKTFLVLVGAGLGAFALLMVWGLLTDKFEDEEAAASLPLQAEKDEP